MLSTCETGMPSPRLTDETPVKFVPVIWPSTFSPNETCVGVIPEIVGCCTVATGSLLLSSSPHDMISIANIITPNMLRCFVVNLFNVPSVFIGVYDTTCNTKLNLRCSPEVIILLSLLFVKNIYFEQSAQKEIAVMSRISDHFFYWSNRFTNSH